MLIERFFLLSAVSYYFRATYVQELFPVSFCFVLRNVKVLDAVLKCGGFCIGTVVGFADEFGRVGVVFVVGVDSVDEGRRG